MIIRNLVQRDGIMTGPKLSAGGTVGRRQRPGRYVVSRCVRTAVKLAGDKGLERGISEMG